MRGGNLDTVFLSYSFRDEDRDLVRDVSAVLESHDLRVVTGDIAGGGALTPEVIKLIDGCDALVAVATPRDPIAGGKFSTHPWVDDELKHARDRGKNAIALRHNQVELRGMYSENEYINYDPAQPLAAFVKLSRTLGKWKKDDGRTIQVMLAPAEEIGRLLSRDPDMASCEYRTVRNGRPGEWRKGFLQREPGGAFAFVNVDDGTLVEIRLRGAGERWSSAAVRQWIRVDLLKEN